MLTLFLLAQKHFLAVNLVYAADERCLSLQFTKQRFAQTSPNLRPLIENIELHAIESVQRPHNYPQEELVKDP